MKLSFVLPLLLLAGCGSAVASDSPRDARSQQRVDQLLSGKTAVGTQSCAPLRELDRQTIVDDHTILYRVSATKVWRNDIPIGCTGLDRNSTLIRRSISSTDICSGEIFEVRDSGTQFPLGACSFGEFTEFRSTPR